MTSQQDDDNIDYDSNMSSRVSFLEEGIDNNSEEKKVSSDKSEKSIRVTSNHTRPTRSENRRVNQANTRSSKVQNLHVTKLAKRKSSKVEEIHNLWKKYGQKPFFLYKPGAQLPDLSDCVNSSFEIRISTDFVTKCNKELINRNVWGSETYTSNSDIVAVMLHHGLVTLDDENLQRNEAIQFTTKVTKTRKSYASTCKNGIYSKHCKGYCGYSLKPEKITWLQSIGRQDEMKVWAKVMATQASSKKVKLQQEPQKCQPISEVNFMFNLCNEPTYKYSISNFCDKSGEIKTWCSYKLKTQVLYIENNEHRYEISLQQNNSAANNNNHDDIFIDFDTYRFSRVKDPMQLDNRFMNDNNVPLLDKYIQVQYNNVDWSEFVWGSSTLQVKGFIVEGLKNYKFYMRDK